MDWSTPSNGAALQASLAAPAVLVLFGGAHCGVCTALRPRLQALAQQAFAGRIALVYADCGAAPALCAQQGVFSLPVLRFYVHGQLSGEWARSFGLREVQAHMARVLALAGAPGAAGGPVS